jgi:hypothetical protein
MSITRGASLETYVAIATFGASHPILNKSMSRGGDLVTLHIGLSLPLSHQICSLYTRHRVMATLPLYKSIPYAYMAITTLHDDREETDDRWQEAPSPWS